MDRPGDHPADQDSNNSADGAERDRLQRELEENIPLGRANGLAHTDFARALGDRDQHDVHHAYATDHETNAGDSEHEDENASGDLVPEIGQRVWSEDREIVGLIEFHVTPAP